MIIKIYGNWIKGITGSRYHGITGLGGKLPGMIFIGLINESDFGILYFIPLIP